MLRFYTSTRNRHFDKFFFSLYAFQFVLMVSRRCGILQGRGRVQKEKIAINPFAAQNCSETKSVVIFLKKKKKTCPHMGFEPGTNAFL